MLKCLEALFPLQLLLFGDRFIVLPCPEFIRPVRILLPLSFLSFLLYPIGFLLCLCTQMRMNTRPDARPPVYESCRSKQRDGIFPQTRYLLFLFFVWLLISCLQGLLALADREPFIGPVNVALIHGRSFQHVSAGSECKGLAICSLIARRGC